MVVILRTGRSFLPLEDCTTTVLLAAQKFLTNCRARPNGSEMGRVLRMRDDGMDHWWQSAHVAQEVVFDQEEFLAGTLCLWCRWRAVVEPGVDDLEPRSRSVGAGPQTGTQSCTLSLNTLLLKIQSGEWQKLVFLLLRYGFREYRGLLKQTEVRRWKMYLRDLQDEDFEIAIKVEDLSLNPNRPANLFGPWPFLAL